VGFISSKRQLAAEVGSVALAILRAMQDGTDIVEDGRADPQSSH
jgi:hypothetical protein